MLTRWTRRGSPMPGSGSLSGGEQQRVLIAHALIEPPRLLLLDEPLGEPRPGQRPGDRALLARIAREQQIAVLLSAHEMNPLLPVMDRIVYLAGWQGGQRRHRRGGHARGAQPALRPPRRRRARARPGARRRGDPTDADLDHRANVAG